MAEEGEEFKDLTPRSPNIDSAMRDYRGKRFPKNLQQLLTEKKLSDAQLHEYCLAALRNCIEHKNASLASRLLEMLGKRYPTKKRITRWLFTFGTFKIKAGKLVYRKRANMNKENLLECLMRANETPFYAIKLKPKKNPRLTWIRIVSGGLPSLGRRR
jgi:hypothetical protein